MTTKCCSHCPAPGHVGSLEVWRDQGRDGSEPLLREYVLWREEGLAPLDEAGYAGYVDPASGPLPGVFLHLFRLSPGWGDLIGFEQDAGGEWRAVEAGPDAEPERAWTVQHAFSALFKGRRIASGLLHRVHLQGDEIVVDDSDLWFM